MAARCFLGDMGVMETCEDEEREECRLVVGVAALFTSGDVSRLMDLLGEGSAERGREGRSRALINLGGGVAATAPPPKSTTHEEVWSGRAMGMASIRSSSVLVASFGVFLSTSNCLSICDPGFTNSNSLSLAAAGSSPSPSPHQLGWPYSLLALLRAGECSRPMPRLPSLRWGDPGTLSSSIGKA